MAYSGDALCSTPLPMSAFLAKLGPCAESYVEKCPFKQISKKFPKNLAYRKCKNLAHYLAKLNGLKWAKLGAEAWHEWLTPAMLYALTGEYFFGEAGTICGKLR